jgi:hypothetical protein
VERLQPFPQVCTCLHPKPPAQLCSATGA